jgi:hypothetical protein
MEFEICVLLYGDHVDLAKRCLGSICRGVPAALPGRLRIGMNACCPATVEYVQSLVKFEWVQPGHVYESGKNIHKYPMMRRMLYDPTHPITTPRVMWFDDDSFIRLDPPVPFSDFQAQVCEILGPGPGPDLLGSVYTIGITPEQIEWIRNQPWFAGVKPSRKMRFVTGGWWVARLETLSQFDYPWRDLDHRGGDVMLGALCEQQGLKIKHWNQGVAINADHRGQESKASRRGFDQQPIGVGYRKEKPARLIDVLPL